MLARETLDVIILALPNNQYENVLTLSELKGKYVLKEKPFAMSLDQAEQFTEIAQKNSVRFNIAQQRFFADQYRTAKKWLDDGLIGDILFFEYRHILNDQKESWYWEESAGGGCWLNVGWHFAFLMEWFFGTPDHLEVEKMSSSKRAFEYKTDDTVFITCNYKTFSGRAYLSVVDSFREDSFRITGSLGVINMSRDCAHLFDNYGNVKEKEKGNELLSYMYQSTGVVQRDLYDSLFTYNIRAMKIIINNR